MLTRYDIAQYAYVGPRTGRNLVSRTQSVQTLLAEVLQLDSVPDSVSAFISELSEKTTVPYKLSVQLVRRPTAAPNRRHNTVPTLDAFLSDASSPPGVSKHPRFHDQIHRALSDNALFREAEQLYLFTKELPGGRMQVNLDLSAAHPAAGAQFSPRAIHFGLIAGFLRLENLLLVDSHGEERNTEAYSAGQWGLFSSLATAAFAARDHSLFLVDEPENALHPAWQREYISDFLKGISHCEGCHLFLATHSPLLVSSLGAKDADLIGLRLIDGRAVEVGLMDVPVGWQATDVLEDVFGLPSTRATAVVEEIESAMALISDGASRNATALKKIAKRLIPLLETLPEDDVARQVIASICRISGVKP
ncbi:AAA family ATPase [Delftia sp. JD2]|uniref:AAA family ATPase n=1 Tax=Delftia sp. JD2 TaxID=469553 RepID=UPI0015868775|nr:AAA family ATPase [Delftia sp. JD2]